ncbi:hypothetical protein AAHC03_04721 [Spirometra sp. Aus1]
MFGSWDHNTKYFRSASLLEENQIVVANCSTGIHTVLAKYPIFGFSEVGEERKKLHPHKCSCLCNQPSVLLRGKEKAAAALTVHRVALRPNGRVISPALTYTLPRRPRAQRTEIARLTGQRVDAPRA